MKIHLAGIVNRRIAAALHTSPVTPSSPNLASPLPLPIPPSLLHSSSSNQLSPRHSLDSPRLVAHTASVGAMHSHSPPPSPTTRSARASPAPGTLKPPPLPPPLQTSIPYVEPPIMLPPLPTNAEEELIQCTFILYVMLDTAHTKMKTDDTILRQLYSVLPELYLLDFSSQHIFEQEDILL